MCSLRSHPCICKEKGEADVSRTRHRWLMANGKGSQTIDILCKLRGDLPADDPKIRSEITQLDAIIEVTQHAQSAS